MIGQEKLLKQLNNYTLDTFPRSSILLGEKGSGKHTVCEYIKDNILKLPLINITEDISDEYLEELYLNPSPNIYVIDMSLMTEKKQNVMLKFIEEPMNTSFIIILCENRNLALNTVLNRCLIFELDTYKKEELSMFLPDGVENKELMLNVLNTPGKLLSIDTSKFEELYNLCGLIVNKIQVASYPNTLTILDKLNLKDEPEKFDLDLFFDTLLYCFNQAYIINRNKLYVDLYLYCLESRKKLIDKRLNKQNFMLNFLTVLWRKVRN